MAKPLLIITGIPRSGTTLTADLIDRLEDTVCLNEPPHYYQRVADSKSKEDFISQTFEELRAQWRQISEGGTVLDRREADGHVPQNYFEESGQVRDMGLRPVGIGTQINDLLLAVKHNEIFTAVLKELCDSDEADIIAIIRHPIPTLLSWQSKEIPLKYGRLSRGYKYWDDALAIEKAGGLIVDIQCKMYELYCARYWSLRDRLTILKYEDIVADPAVLERATGRKLTGEQQLSSHNRKFADKYGAQRVEQLKTFLVKHLNVANEFYPSLDL
jgi:hypothetical protein